MIDITQVASKWQKKWEESKIFEVKEDSKKKKFYCLEMFPYPSGSGLHMGHALNYSIGDIYTRFKRMQGFNVLYPMGYDSFGLPAENAAIKAKEHPKSYTETAIKNFIKQQISLGMSYDWNRIVMTHTPEYYKWNQYFFLKFLEKGIVYRKEAPVNFCEKCDTVLANEQVHNGKCWRHSDTEVKIKHLEQWFIKTTDYAEELLEVENLEWPERIKIMQKNWIGKSKGTEIKFKINDKDWYVFTTRPDTIYGITFMVVSAQHPRLMELVTKDQKKEVEAFLKKIKSTSEKDADRLNKEGAFTGSYALHPLTKEKIPIYTGNFVLAEYGSGMVMAVPAHDQRDFEFAKKYKLPIKIVIEPVFIDNSKTSKSIEGLPFAERESITVILKHWSQNKYLALKWKKVDWGTFITGGVEEGQTPEQAAISEIMEETGYLHPKLVKVLPRSHSKFYHVPKKVNRFAHFHNFYFELKDGAQKETSKEEKEKHDLVWLSPSEIEKFLTPEGHLHTWHTLLDIEYAYEGEGILVNSKEFNNLDNILAKEKITKFLEKSNLGKPTTQYKLRDWLISRQRYWGTPIPIIYCDSCGIVPVKEKDLPIRLPEKVEFGKGNPLTTVKSFVEAKCPKCNKKARRETDTMDTFFDSSWYFLRYCDNKNDKESFQKKKAEYWMPVDQYIGGAEHACMHLIYARFFTKALRDMKFVKFDEPFTKLFNQGMLHKDGFVMSKSRGNIVVPEEISKTYGIDTARFFLMSIGSPDKDTEWSDEGIEGTNKFMKKLIAYFDSVKLKKSSKKLQSKLNQSISIITENIENFKYNLAIIELRNLFENLEEEISKVDIENFLKLLHPFCPHITEELWEKIGNKPFISLQKWPKADKSKIDLSLEYEDQLINSTINDIKEILKLVKISSPQRISLFIAEQWKYDFMKKIKEEIEKTRDMSILIKKSLIKNYEKEIAKLVPSIVKYQGKIPSSILSSEKEFKIFDNNITKLEKEFNCKILINYSKDSNEAKAKQSLPGKPSIIVNLLK